MATNPGSGTQATDLIKKAGNEKCGMGIFFDLKVDKDGKAIDDSSARCRSCCQM